MQRFAGNSCSAPTMALTPGDFPIWTVKHVHVLAGLWELCLAQAKGHGIRRIRVPWCPTLRIIRRSVGGIALQSLAKLRVQQVGAFLPCLGLAHTGHYTSATLSEELQYAAAAGRSDLELVAHPGRGTKDLQTRYSAWKFDWDPEREALLSAEFADAVEHDGYCFGGPF